MTVASLDLQRSVTVLPKISAMKPLK
jgi:hypothetical protein